MRLQRAPKFEVMSFLIILHRTEISGNPKIADNA